MVKKFVLAVFSLFSMTLGSAQVSAPGLPESFAIRTKSNKIISDTILNVLDTILLQENDLKSGIKNRYGIVKEINVDIKKDGTKSTIAGRGNIWQYKIKSPGAVAIGIGFQLYLLPAEAKVFIYNEAHTELLGAFTQINNNTRAILSIADLKSDNAIIEYFEPFDPEFEGELIIGSLTQAYRTITYSDLSTLSRIYINCPLGDNWQDEKHAVCRMTFKEGSSAYLCTGFLVNNTLWNGTNYFMTANHCISSNSVAYTLIAYFNYEYASCNGGSTSTSQSISGATLLATNPYSDFTLLLLNEPIPETYHAYYAGWDITGSVSSNSTSIHHPEGIPKCISTDYDATVDFGQRINWDNSSVSSPNTHWKVVFDQGNVEGGSSGGPLFDANKRVIGQLHGGGDYDEFYGKFSLSWNHGTTPETQLKKWLDPDNSGVMTLDGSYFNIKPRSVFNGNMQVTCRNDTVKFADLSLYRPNEWEWKISPNSYQFVNGTDSSSQNPSVAFHDDGLYNVSLITKNKFGSDTLTKTNYISTVSSIQVQMTGIAADSVICGCDLNKYKISATGATEYFYTLDRLDKLTYTSESNDIYLSIIYKEKKNGNFTTWLKLKGMVGSCISSDSAKLNIVVPVNDNIENAIRLWPGKNGVYSDQCASREIIEPMPPTNDCFSNSGWCPGSTDINGSLWFTFIGPSSGKINIRTIGHNTRMAVYSADSYSQIISNASEYSILAANDNVSISDSTSFIKNLSVEHGKLYWLQVDGDTKKFGNTAIELWGNSIEVLPNPSRGLVNLYISAEKYGQAEVRIFSAIGKLMYADNFEITSETNEIQFDLSHFSTGMYIVHVKVDGEVLKSKLVIVN